jgi:hypothetical protein
MSASTPKQFDITRKTAEFMVDVQTYARYVDQNSVSTEGAQRRRDILHQTLWHMLESAYLEGVNDGIKFSKEFIPINTEK